MLQRENTFISVDAGKISRDADKISREQNVSY